MEALFFLNSFNSPRNITYDIRGSRAENAENTGNKKDNHIYDIFEFVFFGKKFDCRFNHKHNGQKAVKYCHKRKHRKNKLLVFVLKVLVIPNDIKSYKHDTERGYGHAKRQGNLISESI